MRSTEKIDKLVLVVHGVGDPPPGSTVSALARALADEEYPFLYQQESLWLQETSENSKFLSTYPTYRCRLHNKNSSIEMAEVYWGDLSRICHGWVGAIIGLFQILFGFRYVAYVAADQPGMFANWIKRIGLLIEQILQGPVMALNTMLAALTILICANELIWPDAFRSAGWSRVLVLFTCAVVFSVACIGWDQTRTRAFERYWFWTKVTAFFIGTVCFLRGSFLDQYIVQDIDSQHPGVLWYCRLLVCFLGTLWTTQIILMFVMAICWAVATFDRRIHRKMLQVATLLPALSVGLWSHCLILFWLFAADRIEKYVGAHGFREVLSDTIPLLGVQFLMSGLIGITVMYSTICYVVWRNSKTIADFENGSRPPRLIVSGYVLLMLGISGGIGSSLVMSTQFIEFAGHSYHEVWFGKLLAECNKYALSLILPFGFLMGFVLPKLRPVFGIVLEIVNHFVFRSKEANEGLEFDDQFDIRRTTFEEGSMIFARREVVLQRMKRVLLYYAALAQRSSQPMELIVIGHSQGTMVAIEVLNSPDMDCLDKFSRVSLVTMGSPFANLYQHYFPKFYPPLSSSFWRRIRERVRQWVNIFRIDDPVGTEIEFPEGFLANEPANSKNEVWLPGGSHNFPTGCRGHMNYWNDREVLGILKSEVFRADWELPQVGNAPLRRSA